MLIVDSIALVAFISDHRSVKRTLPPPPYGNIAIRPSIPPFSVLLPDALCAFNRRLVHNEGKVCAHTNLVFLKYLRFSPLVA